MPLNWNTVGLVIMSIFQIGFAMYLANKFSKYRILFMICAILFLIIYGGFIASIIVTNL